MEIAPLDNPPAAEFFRSYLKLVVTTHHVMFEKLLFAGDGITLELAELFEDAGNIYLDISTRINESREQNGSLEIEE